MNFAGAFESIVCFDGWGRCLYCEISSCVLSFYHDELLFLLCQCLVLYLFSTMFSLLNCPPVLVGLESAMLQSLVSFIQFPIQLKLVCFCTHFVQIFYYCFQSRLHTYLKVNYYYY